jgi:hypothetical protein
MSVSAPLNVKNGQAALVVTGLQAQVAGFVSLSGNFGIQKTAGATAAQDELLIVSDQAAASLTAGTFVRLVVTPAPRTDDLQKILARLIDLKLRHLFNHHRGRDFNNRTRRRHWLRLPQQRNRWQS